MNLKEIKGALADGKTVSWSNDSYKVVYRNNDYYIDCINGSSIGLTWADETTLNGKEEDFYTDPINEVK